jgi:hypothetical protein
MGDLVIVYLKESLAQATRLPQIGERWFKKQVKSGGGMDSVLVLNGTEYELEERGTYSLDHREMEKFVVCIKKGCHMRGTVCHYFPLSHFPSSTFEANDHLNFPFYLCQSIQ